MRAERYLAFWAGLVARLPWGLDRRVAPTFLAFALINGGTFGIDLGVLTLAHGVLGLPVPIGVTCGYGVALTLSFGLNRVLTFGARERIGVQAVRYAVVVATNFVVLLLGLTTLLADGLGVQYQLARLVAGGCEGLFLYTAMRWWIFDADPDPDPVSPAAPGRVARSAGAPTPPRG